MLRPFRHGVYMRVLQMAYKSQGVHFSGQASYIHHDAYIDNLGGVFLGENIVVSTKAIILSHDYSSLIFEKIGLYEKRKHYTAPVHIGNNCFIGAGAIILPGTMIGNNCIIGAGAVVKGKFDDNLILAGNPARIIKEIK